MKQTINFSQFCDAFGESYKNSFSYEGKRALFDYLEELEESTGADIELDTVSLCCEYSEHDDAIEAASEYFEFEGMTYDEDGDELETRDEVENKAIKFLEDRTTVIKFDGGVIIQQF